MSELRIALAPGSIDGGGIGAVMCNLAEGLIAQGVEVDLLLTSQPTGERACPDGVNVVQLAKRTRKAFIPSVRYLSDRSPDMVISAHSYMHLLLLFASKLVSKQSRGVLIWSFHTNQRMELRSAAWKKRFVETAMRWFSPYADRLVAVSKGVAGDLSAWFGNEPERIAVIENPAWSPVYLEFAEMPCSHPWLAEADTPIILGAGRLVRQKDFATLLRAFFLVRARSQARLVILGEGEERRMLEALILELGLQDVVAMPGRVDNPFPYYRKAEVFVLSSIWEGFGMVLVEAMGCDCKVVATDCPSGPAEILQNGRLGSLVPVGDAQKMADAILNVLGQTASVNAGLEVTERYGQKAAADAYLALMKDA